VAFGVLTPIGRSAAPGIDRLSWKIPLFVKTNSSVGANSFAKQTAGLPLEGDWGRFATLGE
jgi:hypothetical protein